jgi:uncharacterized membrane protein YqaE (UPF0057 family)
MAQTTQQTQLVATPADRMSTSQVVALSSAVAFGTQVAFALLMLQLFTPQEVGGFSVISQIGFFWMTLALAQAQLGLLANQHVPAHIAAQQAWRASLWRGLGLLPAAALALWFSQLALWPGLLWALLLALCQVGWMLAQSFTLRAGSACAQAGVRVLPPLTAAMTALGAALLGTAAGSSTPTLVLSAMLGYAVGAAWLVPALRGHAAHTPHAEPATTATSTKDNRSATLRMAHTLADALLTTAIIVVWQRLYGAEETGWMTALLRVLGFVPAVVHMAWAQVALAKSKNLSHEGSTHPATANPWWLGVGAFTVVIGLGLSCALALYQGWLDQRWHGVWPYIAPLVLWQGSACLAAAFSHRPFQKQSAQMHSWACISLTALQALVLFLPLGYAEPVQAAAHLSAFALASSLGLLGLTVWMARLR